jgi:DUF4097 and DUF4098 domain-containing protein YvlB
MLPRLHPTPAASLSGLIAISLLCCAPIAPAGTPLNERRAADPAGTVEISNTAGSVRVTVWPRNEVEVTGTLGKGSQRLDLTQSGKVTRIKVVLPSSGRVEGTDLVVKIPAASALSVNTVSADIRATGVLGAQRLQAVSGGIDTEAAAEDIECKTVSGDVNIKGGGKDTVINVTTVSGDASLTGVSGEVNGTTVSGDLSVTAATANRSRLASTSGDLGLRGKLGADARIELQSTSGDVRVDLAGPVSADFDVSSFSGGIRNCFGPRPSRASEYGPGTELRFSQGEGAARVRIRTMSGDVSLCDVKP